MSIAFLLFSSAYAQVTGINDATQTPVPGVGHDYIGMLNETVSPEGGSVSIRIGLPVPPGRLLSFPVSFAYDSNLAWFVTADWRDGYDLIWMTNAGVLSVSGWSMPSRSLNRAVLKFTLPSPPVPQNDPTMCGVTAGYVFTDSAGSGHNLYLSHVYNDQKSSGNSDFICQQTHWTESDSGGDSVYQATLSQFPFEDATKSPEDGVQKVVGPDGEVYTGFGNTEITNGPDAIVGSGGFEDRNGNLPDTLGHSVSVSNFGTTGGTVSIPGLSNPYTETWQSSNFTGYSFSTTNLSLNPSACAVGSNWATGAFTLNVLKTIRLPNGQSYQFGYDSAYGRVNKITYPSGGYVRYVWGINPLSQLLRYTGHPPSNQCVYEIGVAAVLQRFVSFDGNPGHEVLEQDFSYQTTWCQSGCLWTKTTTVTTRDLARPGHPAFNTVYTYASMGLPPAPNMNSGGQNPVIGVEKSIAYNDVGGTLLKTATKGWFNQFELACEVVTLGTSGPSSGVFYTYGPGAQVTHKMEYDYGLVTGANCTNGATAPTGVTPTRETVTAYQSFPPTPIYAFAPSILDKPSSIKIYSGSGASGTLMAETDYAYDNYGTSGIAPVSAIGHDDVNYPASYTNRGNLTSRTIKCLQSGCSDAVTTYTYDQTGQVTSVKDPNGNTTQFSYTDNWLPGSGSPPGNTNAYLTTITHPTVGSVTTHDYFQYAYSDGQLTASQDNNDVAASTSTTYSYETSLRRLAEADYPDGGRVALSYNDMAPSPSVTKTTLVDSTAGLNLGEKTIMDGVGHVVQSQLTTDPEGIDNTDATYDGLGRVWKQYNPYRTGGEPTSGITTFTYDALGRATSIIKPDGSTVSMSYSGNCATATDESGQARKTCINALGQLTVVWEDPGNAPHLNYETDYGYNTLGNLTSVTQKGGAASASWRNRSFTYDSLSLLTSTTNPESGVVSYSYDANGNLIKKTSPTPSQSNPATTTKINYCYDALNRRTSKANNQTTCPPATPLATYTFDHGTNGIGRRTGMTDLVGSAAWTYDAMGRVASELRVSQNVTKTTSYTYNLDGSVNSLTYPSGRVLNYTYNGAGHATQVIDRTGPINYVTAASYAPPGELSTSILGFVNGGFAGITTANTYNTRLQPALMSAASPTASVFSLCYDFHLHTAISLPPCTFSASTAGDNGNVYQIVNNRDGNRTQNFTYDNLNRISQANSSGPNWGEIFTVDAWGNLTNRGPVAGKTNYEPLSAAPATTLNQLPGFGYDAAGDMTASGSAGYTYNAEGRLKTAGGATYSYDGDGQRIQKAAPAVTLYWYGTTGEVLDETLSAGALVSEYIFFNGKRVARRDADNSVHYYFSDNLGSAGVITNATGAITEESDYYPYGGEIPIVNGDPNRYKFTGKERDAESGLDNFIKRYHASSMGRFMSPDPVMIMRQKLTDPQQWNMYSYSRNNPLRFMDPTGMYATDCGSLGAKDCANRVKQIDALSAKLAASKNAQDRAIAKTLGTSQDTKNGVTIGFVKDFKDAQGKTLADKTGNTSGLFAAGQSTPDGRPVADIRIDVKGSLKGDDLSATVTHEGSHATDRMDFANSCSATGCSQSLNLTGRQSEQNAYGEEYRFWQSMGQGQQHSSIGSPDQINQFLNQHPDVYPRNTLDNLLFPPDL